MVYAVVMGGIGLYGTGKDAKQLKGKAADAEKGVGGSEEGG